MFTTIICVMALSLSAPIPAPAEPVAGSWRVDGNGFVSILEFKIGEDGKMEGTIYGQPLEGKYDAATKTLNFKRTYANRTGERIPVQEWTGTLTKGKKPGSSILSGTYKSVAGANWGKEDFEYTWNAVRLLTAEEELKAMKGLWVLKSHTPLPPANAAHAAFPEFIRDLTGDGAKFSIDGNRLNWKEAEVSLANDLDLDGAKSIQRDSGHRLVLFTLPTGKGVMASCVIKDDELLIHYPQGCTAKTGTIITYQRGKN